MTQEQQITNQESKLTKYGNQLVNSATFNKSIELLKKGWFLLIILIFIVLFFAPHQFSGLTFCLKKLKIVFLTFIGTLAGILVGGVISTLIDNKGQLILSNNQDFLKLCQQSNGLLFFGPIGSGKTALLSGLAQELPGDNKYATFPCGLPGAEKAQIDFSLAPSQRLGVKEDIFIDEGNLLFQGNIVQEVREEQRFLSHFVAFSRHQGTRIGGTYQRVGQAPIQMREVVTGMFQVEFHHKTDEGIYVRLIRGAGVAGTTSKTDQEYIIFVAKKYFDSYNSYGLKSLKYLRPRQGYVDKY